MLSRKVKMGTEKGMILKKSRIDRRAAKLTDATRLE